MGGGGELGDTSVAGVVGKKEKWRPLHQDLVGGRGQGLGKLEEVPQREKPSTELCKKPGWGKAKTVVYARAYGNCLEK